MARRAALIAATQNRLYGSLTVDPASIASGAQQLQTITVTGAKLGDFVLVSSSIDLGGLQATAYVSAANTVKVLLQNNSGGAVDLGSLTLKVCIFKDNP